MTDENEAPSKPDAPSVTRSSASPTSSLRVTWTAPDMTGKPPVTSYTISYGKKGESQWTERSLTGLQARATLTGLEPRHDVRGLGEGLERRGKQPVVGLR